MFVRLAYYRFGLLLAAVVALTAIPINAAPDPRVNSLTERLNNSSLSFTENRGQFPSHVLYRAVVSNGVVWITKSGMQYQLTRTVGESRDTVMLNAGMPEHLLPTSPIFEHLNVGTRLRNASVEPYAIGREMLDHKTNYFLGNDQSKWVTDVPDYASVSLFNVYPGIDMYCYGTGRNIQHDFSLAPGADPSQIRIEYLGAKSLAISENGDLLIKTAWNTITQHKPVVYQEQGHSRVPLEARYVLIEPRVVGFDLGESYNPTLAMVIDPKITYGTYMGTSSLDIGWDVAVDNCNNAYLAGYTNSSSFPVTGSAYDQTYNGGDWDVFVAKLNTKDSGSTSRIWTTYLGGSATDGGTGYMGLGINAGSDCFVTGITQSTNFPFTAGAYDSTYGGYGYGDIFVTRVDASGSSLDYSTYIGGNGHDYSYSVAVDTSSYAYVNGITYLGDSTNRYPYVKGYESTTGSGNAIREIVLTKLNSAGTALLYSTALGGSGAEFTGYDVHVSNDGRAYICGHTSSSNFDLALAYDATLSGSTDAIISVIDTKDSFANSLDYSTLFGGSDADLGSGIAVKANGNIVITGYTSSSSGLPISGAYQSSLGGSNDVFLAEIDPDLGASGLIYSTYLGGIGDENPYDLELDSLGYVVFVGRTDSTGWPLKNAIDSTYGGGGRDMIIGHFYDGDSIIFSSYLGGASYDAAYGLAIGKDQSFYIAAKSNGADLFNGFIGYDTTHNGDSDAVLIKIAPGPNGCQPGDVNNDGTIDYFDLKYLVDYLYNSGPEPVGYSGRINNCSATINYQDINALSNYISSCTPIGCSACP